MADITAANAVFLISVPAVLPVAQQIQGFAADDIFDFEDVDATETLMGVDGVFSGGMVFMPKPQNIMLQADSASNAFFDAWNQAQQVAMAAYPASAVITLTGIGTSWALSTGYLTRYKPAPDAKRLLQPRRYRITWGKVVPTPVGAAG